MIEESNFTRKRPPVRDSAEVIGRKRRHFPANSEVVDLSSQVPDHELFIGDNDDDEDIPYTHRSSRETTPVIIESDEEPVDNHNSIRQDLVVISEDSSGIPVEEIGEDDDDIREYFVISDEDDESDAEKDDDSPAHKHTSTCEQLQEPPKQNNSNLATVKCAICFDSPKQTFVIPCGHVYCGDCIFKALSSTKQSTRHSGPCSLCRASTKYKDITLVVLKKKKKSLIT